MLQPTHFCSVVDIPYSLSCIWRCSNQFLTISVDVKFLCCGNLRVNSPYFVNDCLHLCPIKNLVMQMDFDNVFTRQIPAVVWCHFTCKQACNHPETPGGAKSFLSRAQFFKSMSNTFSSGAKISRGFSVA